MRIDDRSLYRAKPKDMGALLDALQELFQESGNEVTPTQLKERMEQKLQTPVPLHVVVYAYTSLGFVARKGRKHGEERLLSPIPRY
jgi:NADH:ubiquinone oxidoreductase subunit E